MLVMSTRGIPVSLLTDFSPVPLLLISATSTIEAANKSAIDMFSNLIVEYGSLENLHVGELGVEFPEKRWVTLGMYLERRKSVPSPYSQKQTTLHTHQEEHELNLVDTVLEQMENTWSDTSENQLTSANSPAMQTTAAGASFLKGTASKIFFNMRDNKSKDDIPEGQCEMVDVLLRRPKLIVSGKQKDSSESPSRLSNNVERNDYRLVPATMFLRFVEHERQMFTVMSLILNEFSPIRYN